MGLACAVSFLTGVVRRTSLVESWYKAEEPDVNALLNKYLLNHESQMTRSEWQLTDSTSLMTVFDRAWTEVRDGFNSGVLIGSGEPCSPDLEHLAVKCRPFYLPRKFSSVILTAVYISPQTDIKPALEELSAVINKNEAAYLDACHIVAGDFNQTMVDSLVFTNQSDRIHILEFRCSNISPAPPEMWIAPAFTAAAKVRVIVTFCFFIVSMISNTAILLSVTRRKRKSHIRILILSLTVADLMVTVLVMPLDAVWNITIQWYAGNVACKALNFLKLFAMYASALVLVVISMDRHSAILNPFSFISASHRNKLMLSMAWIASALLAAPQLFIFQVQHVHSVNFTQCVTYGSFTEHWHETFYNMFTFITLYITPLTVMIICYTRILWEISKQMKENRGSSIPTIQNDYMLKTRMKTLKMTIIIVVSFIICWTPYYLLGLWYWFKPDILKKVPEYVNHLLFLFALLHTCSDPVIYGFYTPSFRKDIMSCWRWIGRGFSRHKARSIGEPSTVRALPIGANDKVLNHIQMVSIVIE
ncbi:gonadotropin-releasing hormone II receptor-like [Pristis pectinata]|uniref:gonadotropin-releasing hormone II receptor-like n=1 Tax=Pristis pectinata TaxID=685728 RepID=UPI00223D2BF4|nr:gonadotropin-releasing hormone II receptor-like [Pristis pectinata]